MFNSGNGNAHLIFATTETIKCPQSRKPFLSLLLAESKITKKLNSEENLSTNGKHISKTRMLETFDLLLVFESIFLVYFLLNKVFCHLLFTKKK